MKKTAVLIVIVTIALTACTSGGKITLPKNYEGNTEFTVPNEAVLSIYDAEEVTELYTDVFSDDKVHTVFRIDYDCAWVRNTTGLSLNSEESPEFFDLENLEYKGFDLKPSEQLYYAKVSTGDTFKGYTVKKARTSFENLSGYGTLSEVTFEGEISMTGNLSMYEHDSSCAAFYPFADKNEFLPISWIYDGTNLNWSDAQVNDGGMPYIIPIDEIDDEILTALNEKKKLDVEVEMSELTLHACEYDSRLNSCNLIDIKLI